ncbi:hypothetical protein Taro_048545 [Colocasia esculenta]|uniref:Uncharacterized protein n=1 Tax=Colocasia esculenta TaxID=4460 RepID=A0A843X8F1_COLES|nr:hypothetical protein [Colocasia esculenta]
MDNDTCLWVCGRLLHTRGWGMDTGGAAAGPFIRGCETERWTCVVCPSLWLVKESKRVPVPLLVWDRTVVESGLHHQ